ncbi:MAG TPA: hypothetical protein VF297_17680, partial [Pyrinomonadaceae bacterium]
LRPRTSTLVVVSGINDSGTCLASNGVATTPCTVNVQGTTLEQPPSQPNGGGFNSSLSAGTITLGTPLANGASVNVRFLLGIQQTGTFKFFINIEALTATVLPPAPEMEAAQPANKLRRLITEAQSPSGAQFTTPRVQGGQPQAARPGWILQITPEPEKRPASKKKRSARAVKDASEQETPEDVDGAEGQDSREEAPAAPPA